MLKRLKFVDWSQGRKLTLLILFTNMTLSTLLILTVCRMSVIHELRSKFPWLSGRALELQGSTLVPHGNSDFFFWPTLVTRRKTFFSISLPSSKLVIFFIWFTNIVLVLFLFLLRKSKSDRSFLKNDADGSNWVKWAFNNVSNAQAMSDNKSEYLVQVLLKLKQKTFTVSRNECANTVLFLQLNSYLYILFSRQQSLEDL